MSTQQTKNNKDSSKNDQKTRELKTKLQELEDKYIKLQRQYRQLYDEYALFRQDAQNKIIQAEQQSFEKALKPFLRLIEDLRKVVAQMPEDILSSSWWEWLKKIVEGADVLLASIDVEPVDAQGKDFDENYHEPLWAQEVDESQKGKIVQQYERGYILKKDWQARVIQTAKVIVGR